MKLLLLNPPGAVHKQRLFRICEYLRERHDWDVHVAYLEENAPEALQPHYHNFDEWIRDNHAAIDAMDILELERKYARSSFWKIIVTQRTIVDYSYLGGAYPSHTPPMAGMERIIKALVMFYGSLIERLGIEVVLAHGGDNMHSQTIWSLRPSLNIQVYQGAALMFRQLRYYLSDDEYFASSLLDREYVQNMANYEERVAPNKETAGELLRSLLKLDVVKEHKKIYFRQNLFSYLKNNVSAIGSFLTDRYSFMRGYHYVGTWTLLFIRLKALVIRYWNWLLNEHFTRFVKSMERRPYVYYPLHLQPEAALLSTTPVYSDQLAMVRALSASLPAGYWLAVKDYPIQGGFRPNAFYREVAKLPNVILCDKGMSSLSLIEQAEAVVTIQGTAGLEAAVRGKKVLTFARAFYSVLYPVHYVDAYADLTAILKEVLFKPYDAARHERSLYAFMCALGSVLHDLSADDFMNTERSAEHMRKMILQMPEMARNHRNGTGRT